MVLSYSLELRRAIEHHGRVLDLLPLYDRLTIVTRPARQCDDVVPVRARRGSVTS
jgi:hypothetical protein